MVLMALWSKKAEPGKTDDQSKSEADALIEAFSAKLNETIKPLQEGFTALKADWESIKAEATKEPTPDPNRKPDGTELTPEEKTANREQALFAMNVQTNARITEDDCIRAISDKWPSIVTEARETFKNTPWQKKAELTYAQYCNNVVDMLVGREAKKSGLRYEKQGGKFLIEDGAPGGGEDGDPMLTGDYDWVDPRNPNHRLTGMQQLNRLGIDPKEFSEFLKKSGQVV